MESQRLTWHRAIEEIDSDNRYPTYTCVIPVTSGTNPYITIVEWGPDQFFAEVHDHNGLVTDSVTCDTLFYAQTWALDQVAWRLEDAYARVLAELEALGHEFLEAEAV